MKCSLWGLHLPTTDSHILKSYFTIFLPFYFKNLVVIKTDVKGCQDCIGVYVCQTLYKMDYVLYFVEINNLLRYERVYLQCGTYTLSYPRGRNDALKNIPRIRCALARRSNSNNRWNIILFYDSIIGVIVFLYHVVT